MKLAFLGLGVMGYPMAGHLQKAGHSLTVYNRNAEKAAIWVATYGGVSAATPREAAQGAEIVMMCVGNDNDVRSVIYGADGALAGLAAGAVLVDHTTASADVAREVYAEATKAGNHFIDAPVSGGQAGAENGKLTVMCGGDQAAFDRVKVVLALYAKAVTLMGASGAGQPSRAQSARSQVGQACHKVFQYSQAAPEFHHHVLWLHCLASQQGFAQL